tara:strand:- start:893 stop:16036 length:15144 start_codon:yes stop_codon:yes gene_type:complete
MASPYILPTYLDTEELEPESEPSYKKYTDWLTGELGKDNPTLPALLKVDDANPEDPHGEYVKRYGQYLADTLLDTGEYSEEHTFKDIFEAQVGLLRRRGVLSDGSNPEEDEITIDSLKLFGPKEKDFNEVTGDVLDFTGRDIGEGFRDAASVYNGYLQEGLLDTEQGIEAREKFEAELSNLENRNALGRAMVSERLDDPIKGVAFAEIKSVDEDGEEKVDLFYPRPVPEDQLKREIKKALDKGVISYESVPEILRLSKVPKTSGGMTIQEVFRSREIEAALQEDDLKPYLDQFTKLAELKAAEHYLETHEGATAPNLIEKAEKILDTYEAKSELGRFEDREGGGLDADILAETIAFELNNRRDDEGNSLLDTGDVVTQEEVRSFVDIMSARTAMNYTEYVDPNDFEGAAKSNIIALPSGEVVIHPKLVYQEEHFEKSLAGYDDVLTSEEKEMARLKREVLMEGYASDTDKQLQELEEDEDSYIEGWVEFRNAERDKGAKLPEIIESYLGDEDNFKEFEIRSGGVLDSLGYMFKGIGLALPAVLGSESAKDYFVEFEKNNAKRREIANLFGRDLGFRQDLMEGVAPLIADAFVTGVLSFFTAGLGGAAYVSARVGSRVGIKALTKAMVTGSLKETAEKSAQDIVLRESLDGIFAAGRAGKSLKMTNDEALSIIKGFNEARAGTSTYGQLTRTPGVFIGAANRQSGMAYSSTYAALEGQTNPETGEEYTPEELRKISLASGLIQGSITGLLVSAFSLAKLGGLEDLFLSGANTSQILKAINSFASTKGLSASVRGKLTEDNFKKVVASNLKKVIKDSGLKGLGVAQRIPGPLKTGVRAGLEEFPEEALDQFVNGIVQDAFTGQDTSLFQRLKDSFYAGAIGGILGSSAGTVRGIYDKVSGKATRATQQTIREMETKLSDRVAAELQESGSPITADVVRTILEASSGRKTIPVPVGDGTAQITAGQLLEATLPASIEEVQETEAAIQQALEGEEDASATVARGGLDGEPADPDLDDSNRVSNLNDRYKPKSETEQEKSDIPDSKKEQARAKGVDPNKAKVKKASPDTAKNRSNKKAEKDQRKKAKQSKRRSDTAKKMRARNKAKAQEANERAQAKKMQATPRRKAAPRKVTTQKNKESFNNVDTTKFGTKFKTVAEENATLLDLLESLGVSVYVVEDFEQAKAVAKRDVEDRKGTSFKTTIDGKPAIIMMADRIGKGNTKKARKKLQQTLFHEAIHASQDVFVTETGNQELVVQAAQIFNPESESYDKAITEFMQKEYNNFDDLSENQKVAELTRAIVEGRTDGTTSGALSRSVVFKAYLTKFLAYIKNIFSSVEGEATSPDLEALQTLVVGIEKTMGLTTEDTSEKDIPKLSFDFNEDNELKRLSFSHQTESYFIEYGEDKISSIRAITSVKEPEQARPTKDLPETASKQKRRARQNLESQWAAYDEIQRKISIAQGSKKYDKFEDYEDAYNLMTGIFGNDNAPSEFFHLYSGTEVTPSVIKALFGDVAVITGGPKDPTTDTGRAITVRKLGEDGEFTEIELTNAITRASEVGDRRVFEAKDGDNNIRFNETGQSTDADGNPDGKYVVVAKESPFIALTGKGKINLNGTTRVRVGDVIQIQERQDIEDVSQFTVTRMVLKGDRVDSVDLLPYTETQEQDADLIKELPIEELKKNFSVTRFASRYLGTTQEYEQGIIDERVDQELKPEVSFEEKLNQSFKTFFNALDKRKEQKDTSALQVFNKLTPEEQATYNKVKSLVEEQKGQTKLTIEEEPLLEDTLSLFKKLVNVEPSDGGRPIGSSKDKIAIGKTILDLSKDTKRKAERKISPPVRRGSAEEFRQMATAALDDTKFEATPEIFKPYDGDLDFVEQLVSSEENNIERAKQKLVEYIVNNAIKGGYRWHTSTNDKASARRFPSDLREILVLLGPERLGKINRAINGIIAEKYPVTVFQENIKDGNAEQEPPTGVVKEPPTGAVKKGELFVDEKNNLVAFDNNPVNMARALDGKYTVKFSFHEEGVENPPSSSVAKSEINPAFKYERIFKDESGTVFYKLTEVSTTYFPVNGIPEIIPVVTEDKQVIQLNFERDPESVKKVGAASDVILERESVFSGVLADGNFSAFATIPRTESKSSKPDFKVRGKSKDRERGRTGKDKLDVSILLAELAEASDAELEEVAVTVGQMTPGSVIDNAYQAASVVALNDFMAKWFRAKLNRYVDLVETKDSKGRTTQRLEYDHDTVVDELLKLKIQKKNKQNEEVSYSVFLESEGKFVLDNYDGKDTTEEQVKAFITDVYRNRVSSRKGFDKSIHLGKTQVKGIFQTRLSAENEASKKRSELPVVSTDQDLEIEGNTGGFNLLDILDPVLLEPLGATVEGKEAPITSAPLQRVIYDESSEYDSVSGLALTTEDVVTETPVDFPTARQQEPAFRHVVQGIAAHSPAARTQGQTVDGPIRINVGDEIVSFVLKRPDPETGETALVTRDARELSPVDVQNIIFRSGSDDSTSENFSDVESFKVVFRTPRSVDPVSSGFIDYQTPRDLRDSQRRRQREIEAENYERYGKDNTIAYRIAESIRTNPRLLRSVLIDEIGPEGMRELRNLYNKFNETGRDLKPTDPADDITRGLTDEDVIGLLLQVQENASVEADSARANELNALFNNVQAKDTKTARGLSTIRNLLSSVYRAAVATYNGADISGAYDLSLDPKIGGQLPLNQIIEKALEGSDVEIDLSQISPNVRDYLVNTVSERLIILFGTNVQSELRAKSTAKTVAQRNAAQEANTKEAEELGLKSGDPESVKRAFKKIVNNTDYPLYLQATAQALLDSETAWVDTKFVMAPFYGLDAAGLFNKENNTVTLNLRGTNGKSLASVLIHEYIHAITHEAISNPTKAESPVVSNLRNSYEEIKELYEKSEQGVRSIEMDEGLSSLDEFISYFFTSSTFQNEIKSLAAKVGDTVAQKKNFFRRTIDAILDIIGISKADRRTTRVYDQLVDMIYYLPKGEGFRLSSSFSKAAGQAGKDLAKEDKERRRFNEITERPAPLPSAAVPDSDETSRPLASSPQDPNYRTIEPLDTERQKLETQALVSRVRQLGVVPAEVPVVVDYNYPHPFAIEPSGVMVINPERHLNDLLNLDIDSGTPAHDLYLESVLDQEMAHVADINSLSEKDIMDFAKTLSDAELTRMGEKYFLNPKYELPTDPTERKAAVSLLTSERLRMTFQNVLRGKEGDTESVIAYLKSSNKTKSLEAAYFDRALSSLRYKARLKALSPKERGLITRMIAERRRMALNYRSPNPYATQGLSGEALERNVEILLSQAKTDSEDELEEKAKKTAEEKEAKRSGKTKVEFADQNEHYNFNLEAPVTETLSGDFLTTFNLTLAVREAKDILGGTKESTRKRKVELLVAHYLSDLPEDSGVSASVIGGIGASTPDGSGEPTVRVDVSADNEAALDQVRSRMYALASLLQQQELHEIEVLSVPDGVDIEYGVKEGGFEDQPAGIIELDNTVNLALGTLDIYIRDAGLDGYTFTGQEILIYNTTTDIDPKEFTTKVGEVATNIETQFINDIQNPIRGVRATSIRLRRTSKEGDSSREIKSYEEGYLPDGSETSEETRAATDARTTVARNILRNTGGRITNPVGTQRLLFSGAALSPERKALLTKLAEIYDELPTDDGAAQTREAYDSLIKKTATKFSNLFGTGRGKIKVIVTDSNPYADQESLVNDIRNGQIKIQKSSPSPSDTHPMYATIDGLDAVDEKGEGVAINGDDALRALFRFAQHGVTGSVSPEGAYTYLVSMFSDGTRTGQMASWAAATEIRSEEAYKRFGPENDKNPGEEGYVPIPERKGPPKKAALLPLGLAKTGNEAVDSGLDNLARSLSDTDDDLLKGSYKPKEKVKAPAETPATAPQGPAPLATSRVVGEETQPDQPTQAEPTPAPVEETVPYRLPAPETDYTAFFETFEMPIFEVGTYNTPSNTFTKALKGPYDRRIRQMTGQADSAQKATLASMKRNKAALDRIISKMDPDEQVRINRLISKASGHNGSLLTTEQYNQIQEKYDAMRKSISDAEDSSAYPADVFTDMVTLVLEANPDLSQEKAEAKALSELNKRKFDQIEQLRSEETDRVKKENRRKRGQQQAKAYAALEAENPELARIVVNVRAQIDGLSKKLSKSLGDDHLKLSITIDDNLGIYVTRSYKFFEDADYAKAVYDPATSYEDPKYGPTLKAADRFFKNMFIKQERERLMEDKGLSEKEAEAEAIDTYNNKEVNGMSYGKQQRIDFLKSYKPGKVSKDTLGSNGDAIAVIKDNLQRRDDKPQVIQDLFGVYGEDQGAANLISTLGVVARHAANHSMLNAFKKTAESPTDSEGKWVYSPKEVAGSVDTMQEGQILESQLPPGYVRIPGDLGHSVFSPLQGYFAPEALVDALKKASAEKFQSSEGNAGSETIRKGLSALKRLSGVGMLAKILYSAGHYFRNMVGQSMMAIAQGRPQLMVTSLPHLKSELGYVGRRILYPISERLFGKGISDKFLGVGGNISEEAFVERLKLAGLGIVENEMRSRTIQELLRGDVTMSDVEAEMTNLFKKAGNLKDTVLSKFESNPVLDRLLELEAASENFMKIAVFLDNVNVLTEAAAEGSGKIYGVDLSQMSELDIEKYAAELTLDTMPAHSRTMPIVRAFAKTPAADLVFPFARFTTEVYRTQVNGYTTSFMEMRSGNPVLENRGRQRFLGLLTAHNLSIIGVSVINSLLSDIGLEDEENLDEGGPGYLKNHAILYLRGKHMLFPKYTKGELAEKLFSIDVTFLNPLSPIGDVVSPSIQAIATGKGIEDAVVNSLGSLVLQTLGSQQIVAGAVTDAFIYNTDSSTDTQISIEGVDDPIEAFGKKLLYVLEKGLEPRVVKDSRALIDVFAQGESYEEDEYGALPTIINSIAPFRIRAVPLERDYRSAMYSIRDKRNSVRRELSGITTRKPLAPREVKNTAERYFEKSLGVQKEALGIAQTYLKLGLGVPTVYGEMKGVIGTGFADDVSRGVFRTPEMSDQMISSLQNPARGGQYGLSRIGNFNRARYEYGSIRSLYQE